MWGGSGRGGFDVIDAEAEEEANEDRRGSETELAAVRYDKDRLASEVKTLEATWRRRARPQGTGHGDRHWRVSLRAQVLRGQVGGGRGIPPAFVTFWPARRHGIPSAEAAAAQMSAVATGLRMAPLARGQAVQAATCAPDLSWSLPPRRSRAGSTPPPPTASCYRRWKPLSSRQWGRAPRAPLAPLAGAVLQGGGGGVALPLTSGPPVPSNLHGCYLYIFMMNTCTCKYCLNPPPSSMGNLNDMWGTPPPLCEIFSAQISAQSVFYLVFALCSCVFVALDECGGSLLYWCGPSYCQPLPANATL